MIICAGQSMIDCIMTGGDSADVAEDIALCPGGEAFNEASVLAALGDEVCLSSAIGQDHAGSILLHETQKAGIRICGDYQGRTPVSLLIVDPSGNRKSKVSKIHQLNGYIPSLPEDTKIDFVTMGSLFRPPFLDPQACFGFASAVKKTGAKLLADTKLPKGTSPKLEDYRSTLELIDFITPNEQEAEYYTHTSDPVKAAQVFHSFGVKNVIIKLAEKGCYISPEDDEAFFLPAFETEVIDGIGAGDTLAAGMIHCLIRGRSLRDSAVFASACAAICVAHRGATGAITSADQVEAFLAK